MTFAVRHVGLAMAAVNIAFVANWVLQGAAVAAVINLIGAGVCFCIWRSAQRYYR